MTNTQTDDTPRAAVAHNWKYLTTNIQTAISSLSFDAYDEVTPRKRLATATLALRSIDELITKQRITRLGKFNIRSEIGFVLNSISGIRQGIIDRTIKPRRINAKLPELCSRLSTVAMELTVRAQQEASILVAANHHARAAAKQSDAKIEEIAAKRGGTKTAEQKNVQTHRSIQDAMNALKTNNQKALEEEARKLAEDAQKERRAEEERALEGLNRVGSDKTATKPKLTPVIEQIHVPKDKRDRNYKLTPKEDLDAAARNRERLTQHTDETRWDKTAKPSGSESKDVWDIRDSTNIDNIRQQFMPDLVRMKEIIEDAKIHDNNGLNYVAMTGPVAVDSPNPPREQTVLRAGVEVVVLYREALRPEPAVMHKVKKEFNPPILIFKEQVLFAIGTKPPQKPEPKTGKGSRLPIIRRKNEAESITYSDEQISLLRRDLCAMMTTKHGGRWLDVLQANPNSTRKFITDKHFPHTRFIWLIRENQYAKLGAFSVHYAGFPFSGGVSVGNGFTMS